MKTALSRRRLCPCHYSHWAVEMPLWHQSKGISLVYVYVCIRLGVGFTFSPGAF